MDKASQSLSEQLGISISKSKLKRALKKLGYSWKRFRKSLKTRQGQQEYDRKLEELKLLYALSNSGYVDLFFGDESSFNMEGYVPYGWQPHGEYVTITPGKTPATKVFGLMARNRQLYGYTVKGTVNAKAIIACINEFWEQHWHPSVIVLDNAPIHKSKEFQCQIKLWKEQGLYIYFLPRYSPHLNPIEILWRKMKYEWIQYESIEKQGQLDQKIEEIFKGFGNQYDIDFDQAA